MFELKNKYYTNLENHLNIIKEENLIKLLKREICIVFWEGNLKNLEYLKGIGIIVLINSNQKIIDRENLNEIFIFNLQSSNLNDVFFKTIDCLFDLLKELNSTRKQNLTLKLNLERKTTELERNALYWESLYKTEENNMLEILKWTIYSLENLVNLQIILSKTIIDDIPKETVKFLSNIFDYSEIVFFENYNNKLISKDYKILNNNIKTTEEKFNKILKGVFFSETDVLIPISISYEIKYYIGLSYEGKPLKSFENKDIKLANTLSSVLSSSYEVSFKNLQIQNKLREISILYTSSNLITKFRNDEISIRYLINTIKDGLSLKSIDLFYLDESDVWNSITGNFENIKNEVINFNNDFKNKPENSNTHIYPLIFNNKPIAFLTANLEKTSLYDVQDKTLLNFANQLISALSEKKHKTDANIDGLTKIYNRRYINMISEERFKLAQKDSNFKMSIIMIDIDFFKKVNDTYGHQTGDIILKNISDLLKNNVRDTDVVGRYGGEEFIIILNADLQGAITVAEKIRSKVELMLIQSESHKINISISLGVSSFNYNLRNVNELIKNADENLYIAKKSGRNKVVYYNY